MRPPPGRQRLSREFIARHQGARIVAALAEETMLADRRAAIEGFGLPLADGLALEHRLGRETLAVAARGALRFASGEGRHGAPAAPGPDAGKTA